MLVPRARRWVRALRSGKRKQSKKHLYEPNENGFCCLGVMLDDSEEFQLVAGGRFVTYDPEIIDFYVGWVNEHGDEIYGDLSYLEIEDEEFPEWLREYFGMSEELHGVFIAMNDDEGKTFNQIADKVEEVYLS